MPLVRGSRKSYEFRAMRRMAPKLHIIGECLNPAAGVFKDLVLTSGQMKQCRPSRYRRPHRAPTKKLDHLTASEPAPYPMTWRWQSQPCDRTCDNNKHRMQRTRMRIHQKRKTLLSRV